MKGTRYTGALVGRLVLPVPDIDICWDDPTQASAQPGATNDEAWSDAIG